MGLFDRFRKVQAQGFLPYPGGDFYGAWRLSTEDYERILGLSPAEMWRTQPYLRTIVTFLARNIAQLGLHVFERVGENDRRRVRDGAVVGAIGHPNRETTSYELIYGLVADLALYDAAYWLLSDDPSQPIVRLPVGWVTPRGGDALGPAFYEVRMNDRGEAVKIQAPDVLAFHGWHPGALYAGSSPVHALREILAEQVQAAKYREAVWQRGGKVGAVLSRPAGAPAWGDEARSQFKADWESKFTGDGPRVGGTPLLEDGMTLSRVDFSAHEMEFIEGARLALNTVASVYHVNPTMIGLLDNANYSNVVEFRKMLYGDTLGPIIAQIEDRLNTFLVPRLDSRPGLYVEFNIEEKLQGNFEEQTKAVQSAVGAPWMTVNEGRALRNMPAIDGGDDLVVPLNVIKGGQASPTDSAPKMTSETVRRMAQEIGRSITKGRAPQSYQDKHAEVVGAFFRRQAAVVKSKLGAKAAADWWDGERWDGELSDDLYRLAVLVSKEVSAKTLEAIGFSPDEYDVDRTLAWLREVSDRSATSINAATKAQLDAAVEADDPTEAVTSVFTVAEGQRTPAIAATTVTLLSGFATHEAAKQVAGDKATKTWITGSNPRPEHARMNGETVPLSENFSNGMAWPGDGANAGPDDLAGCNCQLSINV